MTRWTLSLLMVLGGACRAHTASSPDRLAANAEPGESFQAIYPVLAQRDGDVNCAALVSALPDPVLTLSNFINTVQSPPYAPMRAASCLLSERPIEAEPVFLRWLAEPSQLGLALLIKAQLSSLPAAQATRLQVAGRSGPHGEHFADPSR